MVNDSKKKLYALPLCKRKVHDELIENLAILLTTCL